MISIKPVPGLEPIAQGSVFSIKLNRSDALDNFFVEDDAKPILDADSEDKGALPRKREAPRGRASEGGGCAPHMR